MRIRSLIVSSFVVAAAALAGCGGGGGTVSGGTVVEVVPAGTLTVEWSLDGSRSPSACSFYAVDGMNLVVLDRSGFVVSDVVAPCEDFGVSLDLPEGTYDADATLVDVNGRDVSDTLAIDNLTVIGDTEIVSDIDFPDSSIF